MGSEMCIRDRNKTARNRIVEALKTKLRERLPEVLDETGIESEQSLNALIGSRNDDFFDLKHDVINSQEQFVSLWLRGLKESALTDGVASDLWLWKQIKKYKVLQEYSILFLKLSLIHISEPTRPY